MSKCDFNKVAMQHTNIERTAGLPMVFQFPLFSALPHLLRKLNNWRYALAAPYLTDGQFLIWQLSYVDLHSSYLTIL